MINVTNGGTNGGSNTITFNPRDSIEIVSWTDDAGTHARLFGHNERDDALVGVPADARRASFSSAAVVELLLKQAGLTAQTIFAMIEEAHAKHPACAIILNGEQEVAIRKAIRNSGGGDIVPMRAFGTAPTYTGLAMKPSCGFIAIADAPILGVWAGATLIAEHVAEQRRLTGATAQAFVELEAVTQAFGVNSVEAAEATERAKKAVEAAAKAAATTGEAAERSTRERSEFEKIVGVLMFLASRDDTGEAVRMAACHGLQQIGATLAAR